jgi:hypothetical protein
MQAMQLKAELLHGCTVSGLLRNQRRSFTGLLSSVRVVPKQGEADHGTCHHRHTISGLDGFEFGQIGCGGGETRRSLGGLASLASFRGCLGRLAAFGGGSCLARFGIGGAVSIT